MRANWRDYAACVGKGKIMLPSGSNVAAIEAAQRICRRCPVQEECAAYARHTNPTCGIWSGEFYGGAGYETDDEQHDPAPDIGVYRQCIVCLEWFERPKMSRAKVCSETCRTTAKRLNDRLRVRDRRKERAS